MGLGMKLVWSDLRGDLINYIRLKLISEAAGLEVVSLDYITHLLTAGHLKLRHVLKILPGSAIRLLEKATRSLPHQWRRHFSTRLIGILRPRLPADAILPSLSALGPSLNKRASRSDAAHMPRALAAF